MSASCMVCWGSSPRMRGTHMSSCVHRVHAGIIPAYAGNTGFSCNCFPQCRDHPRVCGEHNGVRSHVEKPEGSSPRMRGTPGGIACTGFGHGIIPAYAGNTGLTRIIAFTHGDHPRVCGEHACARSYVQFMQGSSPRMRGTPVQLTTTDGTTGIIPAYAGNTQRPTVHRW